MKSELLINYSLSSSSSSANVLLEQKEWNSNVGYVTKANFVKFVGRMLYGENTENNWGESADCGTDDDNVDTIIYAYPSPFNLAFTVDASFGDLHEVTQETVVQEEAIKFSLSKEGTIKYPVYEMINVSPIGSFYDVKGDIIPFTSITVTVSEQNIKLSQKVYGTLKFRYASLRYAYSLRLPKRNTEETYENFYSSVVWAGWNGGLRWKEVDLPPGAEEFALDNAACGWGGGTSVDTPDDDGIEPPKAAGADRSINIDYCSNKVINDNTYASTTY